MIDRCSLTSPRCSLSAVRSPKQVCVGDLPNILRVTLEASMLAPELQVERPERKEIEIQNNGGAETGDPLERNNLYVPNGGP